MQRFVRNLLWGGMPRPRPSGNGPAPLVPPSLPLRLRDSVRPPWGPAPFSKPGDEDREAAERFRQLFAGVGVAEMKTPPGVNLDESGNPLLAYRTYAFPKSRKLIEEFDIVIIGGGTGGLAVAQKLGGAGMADTASRMDEEGSASQAPRFHYNTLLIDPEEDHYYSPLFAQVAVGERKIEEAKTNRTLMLQTMRLKYNGIAQHLKTSVVEVRPWENCVLTADGRKVTYKQLVVASGLEVKYDRVKGLREALGRAGVSATSVVPYASRTWDFIRFFPGGKAVFASAAGSGAPKLADPLVLAAEDYWRRYVGSNLYSIHVLNAQDKLLPVPKYEQALAGLYAARGVRDVQFGANLVEIRAADKQAVFEHRNGQSTVPFDFLHVVPPTGPHAYIAQSEIADDQGWVDVDSETLQHKKFPNIFALGDCAGLPIAKSVAATSAQAHVLAENLIRFRENRPRVSWAVYNGYTATGITVNHNSSLLFEWDYSGAPRETFPIDGATPSPLLSAIQKDVFEWAYWERVLSGKHDMAKAQYLMSLVRGKFA